VSRLDPRVRTALVAAATLVAILVCTQFAFPGAGGGGRGTPVAILFRGVVLGAVGALTSSGIVLLYRTIRIINFAQIALGIAGGILAFDLVLYTPVPFPVALLIGLATGGFVGFVVGLLALRFARAPRLVLTVFAILTAFALALFSPYVDRLGIFPPFETRPIFTLDEGALRAEMPFAGLKFTVGDFPFSFGYAEIFALQFAVVALLALGAFLRYTRSGVAVRAMAENADRASLLGIGTGALSIVVWTIAGVLGAATVILAGVITSPTVTATGFGSELLLPALAAAVIARMRSLPVAAIAAVGISVAAQAWRWSFPDDFQLFTVVLLAAIVAGLFLSRRERTRSEQQAETSSWVATQEQRPVPPELRGVRGVRIARVALIVLGLTALAVYPFAVSTGATNIGGVIALNAIAVLSLVVLTGWAGQVSLGQYAFVALGAVIGGALTGRVGVPFWFAVPATALMVALLAAVIGLPALRVQGLFLLVVTFAFAAAVQTVLFDDRYFGWLLPEAVDRPTFFFFDFEDERSMYFLCVLALVGATAMIVALRRTRVGRNLIALRDNEAGTRSFGIAAVRTKLLAFAISGGLAGFAGAIYAHQQRGVSAGSFTADASLQVFIQAVFGGVGSVGGALLGSAYFTFVAYFFTSPVLLALLGPLTTLLLLYAAPAGLISLVNAARDGVLGIVAQRRNLVVPSLIADFDPELAAAHLTPLADPLSSGGLAALGPRRFAIDSELHGDSDLDGGRADIGALQQQEEAAVLAAAIDDGGDR
jgi:branched-chain amino acid transport system permease protein